MIEFDKDCKWDNFMTPNFTASHPYARAPRRSSAESTPGRPGQDWPGLRGER
jgi:hypothetical protein